MIAWIRSKQSKAKLRFAALLSLVVLVAAVGIVSANGGMKPPGKGGMWGPRPGMWHYAGPIPTFTIIEVVKDQDVVIRTSNFPADEDFVVTMGPMGTRGIDGEVITTVASGDGGTRDYSFTIPEPLRGMKQISIRMQTEHESPLYPFYAFNWFYNTTATIEEPDLAAAESEGEATTTESEGEATTTEGEGEATTTEGEGEATTTEGEGEATTTEGEGEATTTEGEGEATTTEGEGEATTTEGEGEATTTEGEGEATTTEGEGEATTTEGEGEATTTEGEGEATTTEGEGEATTTEGEGEATTTEGEGEATTTEGEGEATTEEGEEAATDDTGLVGTVWLWQSVTDPVQGEVAVEMPEQYTIEFTEDGGVNIKADCNVASGSYMAEDSSLTVAVETSTRALCAEDSLSDDFLTKLNAAAIYFFEEGNLFMDLAFDSGTLQFGDASAESPDAATRGAASKTALQDDEDEEADDPVPSFTICSVERGVSVSIVTADFPADDTFKIQMGVVQKPPMKKGMGMGDMAPMPMPMPMPMDNMGMGMDMSMGMSMDMGSKWHKPMPPKIWIPYYDAGELETGEGGEIEATLDIPAQLAGAYKINILMRADDGHMSYNWFYNNTADVCEEAEPNGN